MTTRAFRRVVGLIVVSAMFAAAGATASQPPAATPPALPKTCVPELRTNGDLGSRHQGIVARAQQGGYKIAFVGDSITEGWGGAGKKEWETVWGPRGAVNCGIGGDRTQHVLGRLDDGLMETLAASNNDIQWVVLMIGTNNTGADSAEDISVGVKAIVERFRAKLPKAKVLVFAVFPRGQWPNPARDTINAVNVRLAKWIGSQKSDAIRYADIGPQFLKSSGELPGDLMPDFLHLSGAGYKVWSDALVNVVRE